MSRRIDTQLQPTQTRPLGTQKACFSAELFYSDPLHVLVVLEEEVASAKPCQPDSAQFLIAIRP